jgi:hypothetical protein
MGSYLVQDTPSGAKTLVYRDGSDTRIHSAYDPAREADRAAGSFPRGRASVIIACGLGLGYHLGALRRLHPGCELVAVERDREVVGLARAENPDLLEGVHLVTSSAEIPDALELIDMATFRGAAVYQHRPSYLLDRDFYDGLAADIQQYFTSRLSDMLTRFEFAGRWTENILGNIHHAYSAAPVRALFGAFRGMPGIIVSAGPSLRKNIALLAEAREKALVVCVDTAFKIMEKHGISPHIVMTLDAQRHSVRHFLGIRDRAPLLLADLVSFPAVLRDYGGPRALSTTSKYFTDFTGKLHRETTPLIDWIERSVPSPGDIQSGGSVATSAFDLLLNLGCDPIILTGQDLAYTGREIHCSGSHHNEEWVALVNRFRNLECINQGVIRKRKIKRVESFGGRGEVISDFVFDLYRGWFADSARKVPVRVINATEGGARIAHADEMTLREAVESMPRPKESPELILARGARGAAAADSSKLLEAVDAALADIEGLLTLAALRDGDADTRIAAEAGRDGIAPVLDPLLKKTRVYLARHPELDGSRAASILAGDTTAAAAKMRKHLTVLRDRLYDISRTS